MNIELLDKAINIIKEHPEHWDQTFWHCGTSHCLAGHVHLLVDGLPYNHDVGDEETEEWETFISITKLRAINSLEISTMEAWDLFDPDNSLEDIISLRNSLVEKYNLPVDKMA